MVSSLDPALAEVWRGPYLEAIHHGAVAVTGPDGVRLALGDASTPFLARSAVKPIQAVAMLRHGLDVEGTELALAGASHDGEPIHVDGAHRVLEGAGLSPAHLQTTLAFPSRVPLDAWLAQGRGAEAIAHNCSGKHSAMLRTCVRAGWPTDTYLSPDHPLQVAIREELAAQTGEPVGDPVVDGCGAPAFPTSLTGLARAFGKIAGATDGPERRLADAFRAHPEFASGTRRDEVVYHREVPGLICKAGAEGTLALGLPDGTGIAIKITDGRHRGTVPVAVAVLKALGHTSAALEALDPEPVLGHGTKVGHLASSQQLLTALAELDA
ncbi:asparaginase [Tessaracoccus sp. MC1865]|uniref:asparaginase n=1 Tax=Tessaracoccus sp. MC1865 TaxID=2760310 RepID=UPI0016004A87|nr:asparaginase [Tessaracoccus sp. MC1865]MBB1484088.1 asparaginase [Tessaracoccus sp. MC1865]QTO37120.1 asparaginase [Tessaracoccus sp. MC1865]